MASVAGHDALIEDAHLAAVADVLLLEPWEAIYAPDAVILPPGGPVIQGSETIRELFRQEFERFDTKLAFTTQAIEVDRISDDPPERVQGWLASVSEESVRQLDLLLLLDLLRLENDHVQWRGISTLVTSQIERLTLLGDALAGGPAGADPPRLPDRAGRRQPGEVAR